MRVVVCAANKYGRGQIILGVRHYDHHMRGTLAYSNSVIDKSRYNEIQGFVDNKGEFLTRTEAWKVAVNAGQIIKRVGGDTADGGTLYSENLY